MRKSLAYIWFGFWDCHPVFKVCWLLFGILLSIPLIGLTDHLLEEHYTHQPPCQAVGWQEQSIAINNYLISEKKLNQANHENDSLKFILLQIQRDTAQKGLTMNMKVRQEESRNDLKIAKERLVAAKLLLELAMAQDSLRKINP